MASLGLGYNISMIKTNIKATNLEITPSISDYIEKKLLMLQKFFSETEDVLINVEVGKTSRHHKSGDIFKAEIHLIVSGNDYYKVSETEDLYASIDEAKDDIARELSSHRKKAIRMLRRGALRAKMILKGIIDAPAKSWKRFRRK